MASDDHDERLWGALAVVALVVFLTGPLFPIGIEHLFYMIFFCYGSSNGYKGHINIDSSAPDWPGTVQKHSDTSTTLKKYVDQLIGTRKAWIRAFLPQSKIFVSAI